ncbi:ribonuclease M5 [Beduini massiliensis]|uniref:ribonuclease M5 n=1 Tax=Beduini massiliensis TaxID=1585974 RepID=UPI00059AADE8|nr:ribonuclease M5 [Beduini massiliensis]
MKINEVIIVEGKTDTQVLKSFLDVDTIETGGSGLNQKTLDYIKTTSLTRDIIVMTDPDFPGKQIRDKISKVIPHCKHAFVNKKDAIKHHKVGIAEATQDAILEALENVVTFSPDSESITWSEFIQLDIIGNKKRREEIYDHFHLGYGNVKTLFKRLNLVGITAQQIQDFITQGGKDT